MSGTDSTRRFAATYCGPSVAVWSLIDIQHMVGRQMRIDTGSDSDSDLIYVSINVE